MLELTRAGPLSVLLLWPKHVSSGRATNTFSIRVNLALAGLGGKEALFSLELSADRNTHRASSGFLSLWRKRTA